MGLFNLFKGGEGGWMDTIRCDEKDFLIWKWRPQGNDARSTYKENAIRWGSSISVRPGQAAVFLYNNKEGQYDIIKGPYNGILKTENLPILASIIGLAYDGGTPFQAELYFINLGKNMEVHFTIPYFRIVPAEPEYKAYDIEVAIKGTMAFEISTEKEYMKYFFEAWSGTDMTMDDLDNSLKNVLVQEVKQIVSNAPKDTGVFVMHFNSLIGELGQYVLARLQNRIMNRFGIIPTDVIISDIRYDDESESYQNLKRITEEQAQKFNLENEKNALLSYEIQRETMRTDADIRNQSARQMMDTQLKHQADMMSRMRSEAQFAHHQQSVAAAQQNQMMNEAAAARAAAATDTAAHRSNLGSESAYIGAHQVNVQADVMKTGLSGMGEMGAMNMGNGEGHMNPAGMMASMMMGTAVAGQMGHMMNNMGSALNGTMPQQQAPGITPPPMPQTPCTASASPAPEAPTGPATHQIAPASFFIGVGGQPVGPFDVATVTIGLQTRQINADTLAWCEGMETWAPLKSIPAFCALFQTSGTCPPSGVCPPPLPPTM